MGPYYDQLKKTIFSPPNGKFIYSPKGDISPKVVFHMNREFNDLSSFVLYDFFVELYQQFGSPILPIEITDGCIMVTALLEQSTDNFGQDFRYLMLTDPAYHEVFRRYGVQTVYLHGFPVRDNVDYHKFSVNRLGKPSPV